MSDNELDAELAQVLQPPRVPADFRARLTAAITAVDAAAQAAATARLQREYESQCGALAADHRRRQRLAIAALVVGGLLAVSIAQALLPWLRLGFGSYASLVLTFGVLAAGVGFTLNWPSPLVPWLE